MAKPEPPIALALKIEPAGSFAFRTPRNPIWIPGFVFFGRELRVQDS
jgi:hypothetical protein